LSFPIFFLIFTQFGPFSHTSAVQIGIASQYSQGMMQQAIVYRQRHNHVSRDLIQYDGFIAVLEANDIGREYWIRPTGARHWEKFLAVDCAGIADGGYAWMINNGIIAEVDYASAKRWGVVGRGVEIEMIPLARREAAQ